MSLFGLFGPPDVKKLRAKRNVKGLIKALRYPESKYIRRDAANALGEFQDKETVISLIRALKDPDRDVRIASVGALRKIKNDQAIEPLVAALKDSDDDVRNAVEHALIEIRSPLSIEPLIPSLRDTNSRVRNSAARILGSVEAVQAVEPLIMTLRDSDKYVRSNAAKALGEIKDPQAIEPLIEALKDSENDVRRAAIESLRRFGDLRVVKPLVDALKNSDRRLQKSILIVLNKLNPDWVTDEIPETIVPILVTICDTEAELFEKEVLDTVKMSIIKIGDPAVTPLLKMLKAKGWAYHLVLTMLDEFGDRQSVGPVVESLLQGLNDDRHMRSAVAADVLRRWLEQTGAGFASEDLRKLAKLNDRYEFPSIHANCGFTLYDGGNTDLTLLKQLARQELIRRGEKA